MEKAIKDFKEAWYKLVDVWYEATDEEEKFLNEKYPFKESFDEVQMQVYDWLDFNKEMPQDDKVSLSDITEIIDFLEDMEDGQDDKLAVQLKEYRLRLIKLIGNLA